MNIILVIFKEQYKGVWVITIVLESFRIFISIIPRKIALWVGVLIGNIFYLVNLGRLNVCKKNIELIFGNQRKNLHSDKITYKSYLSLGKTLIDFLKIYKEQDDFIEKHIEFEGEKLLLEALQNDKKVMVLTAHLGAWELLSFAVSKIGVKGGFVVKSIKNKKINDYVRKIRNASIVKPIEKKNSSKEIITLLKKKGHFLGMVMDQSMNKDNGVFVKFGAEKAYTLNAPAILARRFDIDIFYLFMVRKPDDNYKFICTPNIEFQKTDDAEEDIIRNTEKTNEVLLQYVKRYPEQWIWMHKRFKNRPSGKISLY